MTFRQQQFPSGHLWDVPGPNLIRQGFGPRRTLFFGNPYHGLVEDGVLTLPNAATKNYTHLLDNAYTFKDLFNWRCSVPVMNPGQPVPVRTIPEQAIDTANGFQWKEYALAVGQDRLLWGANNFELGPMGWIYFDPAGQPWYITLTDPNDRLITGAASPSPALYFSFHFPRTLDFTIKKFGYFASTPAQQAIENAISYTDGVTLPMFVFDIATWGASGPETFQFYQRLPYPTLTDYRWQLFIGTHSAAGDKVSVHLVPYFAYSAAGVAGPQWRSGAGGFPGPGTVITGPGSGGTSGTGAAVCWIIECTGTPGVDFDMTVTERYSQYDANHIIEDNPLFGTTSFSHFGAEMHTWIKPDGTVEDITYDIVVVFIATPNTTPPFPPATPPNLFNSYGLTINTPDGSFSGSATRTAVYPLFTNVITQTMFPAALPCSCQAWMIGQQSGAPGSADYVSMNLTSTLGGAVLPLDGDPLLFSDILWSVSIEGVSSLTYDHYYAGDDTGATKFHHVYV